MILRILTADYIFELQVELFCFICNKWFTKLEFNKIEAMKGLKRLLFNGLIIKINIINLILIKMTVAFYLKNGLKRLT